MKQRSGFVWASGALVLALLACFLFLVGCSGGANIIEADSEGTDSFIKSDSGIAREAAWTDQSGVDEEITGYDRTQRNPDITNIVYGPSFHPPFFPEDVRGHVVKEGTPEWNTRTGTVVAWQQRDADDNRESDVYFKLLRRDGSVDYQGPRIEVDPDPGDVYYRNCWPVVSAYVNSQGLVVVDIVYIKQRVELPPGPGPIGQWMLWHCRLRQVQGTNAYFEPIVGPCDITPVDFLEWAITELEPNGIGWHGPTRPDIVFDAGAGPSGIPFLHVVSEILWKLYGDCNERSIRYQGMLHISDDIILYDALGTDLDIFTSYPRLIHERPRIDVGYDDTGYDVVNPQGYYVGVVWEYRRPYHIETASHFFVTDVMYCRIDPASIPIEAAAGPIREGQGYGWGGFFGAIHYCLPYIDIEPIENNGSADPRTTMINWTYANEETFFEDETQWIDVRMEATNTFRLNASKGPKLLFDGPSLKGIATFAAKVDMGGDTDSGFLTWMSDDDPYWLFGLPTESAWIYAGEVKWDTEAPYNIYAAGPEMRISTGEGLVYHLYRSADFHGMPEIDIFNGDIGKCVWMDYESDGPEPEDPPVTGIVSDTSDDQ